MKLEELLEGSGIDLATLADDSPSAEALRAHLQQTLSRARIGDSTHQDPFLQEAELILRLNGYRLLSPFGKDENTRSTWNVAYDSGGLNGDLRLAKIPIRDLPTNSPTTQFNFSKGDLDEREATVLSELRHSGIIRIYDAFPFHKRHITVEELFESYSVAEIADIQGGIEHQQLRYHIIMKSWEAIAHMHQRGFVHRDMKGTHILVGKNALYYGRSRERLKPEEIPVKICDLQNVGRVNDLEETLLPTRGGTAFTHPYMLEGLLNQVPTKASAFSDMYAHAMTIGLLVKGSLPIRYSLKEDEKSNLIITFSGGEIPVRLCVNNEPIIKSFNRDNHNHAIKTWTKGLPKRQREFFQKWLAADAESGSPIKRMHFDHVYRTDLEKAFVPQWEIPFRQLRDHAKTFVTVAAGVAGLTAALGGIRHVEREYKFIEPGPADLINEAAFRGSTLGTIQDAEYAPFEEIFHPYFLAAKHAKDAIEGGRRLKFLFERDIGYYSAGAVSEQWRNARLARSLWRSILVNGDVSDAYEGSRWGASMIPRSVIEEQLAVQNFGLFGSRPVDEYVGTPTDFLAAREYLLSVMEYDDSRIEDVLARYFLSKEEITEAQRVAGTESYYGMSDGEIIIPGYREHIHPVKRNLIDAGTAFYTISDARGNLHTEFITDDGYVDWEALDSSSNPNRGDEDRYNVRPSTAK